MNIATIARYLVGSRSAILTLAGSKWTILLGMIFVLSAGLAREYDGEDLIREPWHALRPLGASLVTGTTLFLIAHAAYLIKRKDRAQGSVPFWSAYSTFLGLFWLTAPMAWLYAIPYERFMTPVDAIILNLWTLALVAGWRVVLMIRVVQVLYGINPVAGFFFVMMFADAVLLAAMYLAPLPIIDVMGGIRHNERDELISGMAFSLIVLGILTEPLWIIGSLASLGFVKPRWHGHRAPTDAANTDTNESETTPQLEHTTENNTTNATEDHTTPNHATITDPFPRKVFIFAAATVLAFLPLLFITQPEQMNRRDAERLLTTGQLSEAFEFMSRKQPRDFPPSWDPPPQIGYRGTTPSIPQIIDALENNQPAEWVDRLYVNKLMELAKREIHFAIGANQPWPEIAERMIQNPTWTVSSSRPTLIARTLRFLLNHDKDLTASDRTAIESLLVHYVKRGA